MNILRSYVQLKFLTKTAGNLVLDSSVNADIISVETHKDICSPMGSFTIILGPRIAKSSSVEKGTILLSDIIQPYDLVQIDFKTDGGYNTEMIGLVARASSVLTVAHDGKPQRVIKIDGFDLGKAIQNFKLFFNPYVQTTRGLEFGGQVYFGSDNELFYSKNPRDFIIEFLRMTFDEVYPNGPFYPLSFGENGNLKLTDLIDFASGISTVFENHTILDPFFLLGIGAGNDVSIYDLIKFYSDTPFHEVFIDLRRPVQTPSLSGDPVKQATQTHTLAPKPSTDMTQVLCALETAPGHSVQDLVNDPSLNPQTPINLNQPYVLTMRTTPFGRTAWNALNTHYFLQTDVIQQNVATSEENIFNYFEVECLRENIVQGHIQVSALNAATQGKVPIFDSDSIKKFGLKRYPSNTTKYVDFITVSDKENSDVSKKQAAMARELFRWFSFGELFENGTITLKGRAGVDLQGITMGSRLVECRADGNPTGKEFYIEGVTQEWQLGQPLRTTATVTRGHYPNAVHYNNRVLVPSRFSQVEALEKKLELDSTEQFEDIPF